MKATNTIKSIYNFIYDPIRYNIYRPLKLLTFLPLLAKNIKEINKKITELTNAKPKTIYIVQHSFYDKSGENYNNGGGERYAIDLANIFKEKGYNVVLFQIGKKRGSFWHQQKENLDVIGVSCANDYEYAYVIRQLLKPKLTIYACTGDFGKKLNQPSIRISYGITWDVFNRNANIKKIYNAVLKGTDILVSVDTNTISWFRATFSKTLQEENKSLNFVPNYVDLTVFNPNQRDNDGRIKIAFPRRLCGERGYWLLSSIISDVIDKYDNVDFELVGYPHRKEVKADLKCLLEKYPTRISHKIVDADKMNEVYRNADISLIPTIHSEGTSLSCLEAMACGNAVISTNIGGLTNLVIDGYNGLLINPDKEELKQAISKLVENEALRKELATNAIAVSKKFSKDTWEQRWLDILQRREIG